MNDLYAIAEGRYLLIDAVGEGGMATVYRGFDRRLQAWRAVKVLSSSYAKKKKLKARFEAEARTMALLEHRNVVRVYDVGTAGIVAFIVMELVDCGTLVDWLEAKGPMPPRLAADVILQVADGIGYAHSQGVIHRDIKPHNILITHEGVCRVTDFGIARVSQMDVHLTKTGAVMGTWGYMAPEQRTDAKAVDERADIYGLAATFYTLLTNQYPMDLFAADRDEAMLEGVPSAFKAILVKATEYRREDRYASMDDFKGAINKVRETLSDDVPSLVLGNRPRYEVPTAEQMDKSIPLEAVWAQQANDDNKGNFGQTLMPVEAAVAHAPTMAPGEWLYTNNQSDVQEAEERSPISPNVIDPSLGGPPAHIVARRRKKRPLWLWFVALFPGGAGVVLLFLAGLIVAVPSIVSPEGEENTDTQVTDQPPSEPPPTPPVGPDKETQNPETVGQNSETTPQLDKETTAEPPQGRRRSNRRRQVPSDPPRDTDPVPPEGTDTDDGELDPKEPAGTPRVIEQCVRIERAPDTIRPGMSAGFTVRLCDEASSGTVYLHYRVANDGTRSWQRRAMKKFAGNYSHAVKIGDEYTDGLEYYVTTDGASHGSVGQPAFVPTVHL